LTNRENYDIFLKKVVRFMKISAKARYGLAAVVSMAESGGTDESVTVISISERLKISKIYLEQVFSLLRRGDIVISIKGAQGGYRLARPPKDISVFDVLFAIENSLFEKTESTVPDSDVSIEKAMFETVFDVLDGSVKETLGGITLEDIVNQAAKHKGGENYMYYL